MDSVVSMIDHALASHASSLVRRRLTNGDCLFNTTTGAQSLDRTVLADRLVELDVVDSISYKTVWETLKKTTSSRGKNTNGVLTNKRRVSRPYGRDSRSV